MLEDKTMDYRGCSIFYQIKKAYSDRWIIFLHGAGVDHRMFTEQVKAVPKEYNILLWDARAHGKSVPNTRKFSMTQLRDDILELMKMEQIQKAVFIGQSMGGNLSQDIAYYHPEKVAGMILIDCTNNTAKLSRVEKIMLSISKPIFALYPWKTLVKQSAGACGLRQEVKEYVEECFNKEGKEAFVEILMEVTKCLHEDSDYKIEVPFMLLCGDNDATGNIRKIARPWSVSEPNCTFFMISNASHNSNQDNPDEVNAHINNYLRNLLN